jgi:hypothetical protein
MALAFMGKLVLALALGLTAEYYPAITPLVGFKQTFKAIYSN